MIRVEAMRKCNTWSGILLVLATLLTAGHARADKLDYTLEEEEPPLGRNSPVVLRLVDHKHQKLVPGASIKGQEALGTGDRPTMMAQVTAVPFGNQGRYVIKSEPGMKVFAVVMDADIKGEREKVHSEINLRKPHK